ncbi:MAG: hypothetical protein Q9222_002192 [Ikaeria aurantiellina]
MHLLYNGSQQEKVLQWKRVQDLLKQESEKMGTDFGLQDSLSQLQEPDPTKYRTFNDFFARAIREDARPIDEPQNDLVSSSPSDYRLTAFPTIDFATKYWIKGFGFSLEKLLGDADTAQRFDGDYHRWYAPLGGRVETIKEIPGTYYTVNPQAINQEGTLDVYCENRRSVMLVKRASTGSPIAIVAVGAMLVGSIKYFDGVDQPGATVRRGQCLGAFYYGGSTVIVLYPRGEITLDADLVKNSTEQNCETLMRVGWRIGLTNTIMSTPKQPPYNTPQRSDEEGRTGSRPALERPVDDDHDDDDYDEKPLQQIRLCTNTVTHGWRGEKPPSLA